ncbi:hypothetical protein L7F22_037929 [Adiantum nelumboides]|nr:hypothetical protein [Adiantum nelumboides]
MKLCTSLDSPKVLVMLNSSTTAPQDLARYGRGMPPSRLSHSAIEAGQPLGQADFFYSRDKLPCSHQNKVLETIKSTDKCQNGPAKSNGQSNGHTNGVNKNSSQKPFNNNRPNGATLNLIEDAILDDNEVEANYDEGYDLDYDNDDNPSSDHGGEYTSHAFKDLCLSAGIRHEFSITDHPQQNDRVEHKNRTLFEAARAMLLQAILPDAYWEEATATACYIQNRIPSTRNPTTTPYTLWHGHPPHLGHLRIFGSIAYPLVMQSLSKLSPHAQRTIFGGYGDRFGIKTYRLYIQDHHKFIFARTVVFDEEFILSDINKFESHNSTSTTSPSQHTSTLHLDQAASSSHGRTRSLREIYEATSFSAVFTNETILEHPQEPFEDALPLSVHDALASSESKEWHAAILDELQTLEAANTWELVPPPEHHNIVSCKWLLKKKYHPNGSVDRYKARIVARSFTQQEGVDYFDTYSPRQLLYADHTASGRSLVFIEKFILQYVLPFYGNTHTEDSFVGRRTTSMVQKSAKYIKRCMGGTSNDALLFCGSGCTGALKRLQEHHSNLLSWRQSLAEVVEIPPDEEGFIDLVALKTALDSPSYQRRRKLGSFSACSNVTGLITDTRAVARLLHGHGAFACFDFAAGAPQVQIDMRSSNKDGYDAIVLSPHKFMGEPNTPGVLLMRKSLYMLGKFPPSTCGGGTVSYVNGFHEKDTLYVKEIEEREDSGTPQIVQKIRCALAFWVKDFIGTSVIEQRESFFIKKAITRLSDNPNVKLLGNLAAQRAPVLSFLVFSTSKESSAFHLSACVMQGKPLHGQFVVKLLNDLFGIQARGGCACAGPYGHLLLGVGQNQSRKLRSAIKRGYQGLKPGWARLSFPYDMTDKEVEYVLVAIEMVAKYGQCFLPLYDVDWKTGDWTFKNLKGAYIR